jgi:hypothetical protein
MSSTSPAKKRTLAGFAIQWISQRPLLKYLGGRVVGEYYSPKTKAAPLAILVHGMGERSEFPAANSRTLAKKGIASSSCTWYFTRSTFLIQSGRYPL